MYQWTCCLGVLVDSWKMMTSFAVARRCVFFSTDTDTLKKAKSGVVEMRVKRICDSLA